MKFVKIFLLMGLPFSCGGEKPTEVELIRPVRYQAISAGGAAQARVFSGTAQAGTETRLSFRLAGRVEKVNCRVGQRVKKGVLVAQLDERDLRLQFEQALAAEKNAEVQKQTARAALDRVRGLYEGNNVSLAEYEAAKNSFAAARSTLETSKKTTNLQRSQLDYGKLYAPMDGFIGAVNMEVNENIAAGNVVAVLSSESDLEITVGLPETVIAQVKTGMTASVLFSALPNQRFESVVTEVSYAIDKNNFTYPVTVKLTGNTATVRPGMAVDVSFNFVDQGGRGTLVAPLSSVAKDSGGHFLYVVEATETGFGVVHLRRVRVGKLSANGFVILEGVTLGDRVVTAGINKISDGLTVRLLH